MALRPPKVVILVAKMQLYSFALTVHSSPWTQEAEELNETKAEKKLTSASDSAAGVGYKPTSLMYSC